MLHVVYTTCNIHLIHSSIHLQKEYDGSEKEGMKKTSESEETILQGVARGGANIFGEEDDWMTLVTGSIRKEQPSSGKKNFKKSFDGKDLFSALDNYVRLFGESLPSANELKKKTLHIWICSC